MNKDNTNAKRNIGSYKNIMVSFGVTIVFFIVLSVLYPSLYVLNDDLMIQSILSGRISSPSFFSLYLSSELGCIISLLYRIAPALPWLGLFFQMVYVLCFLCVLYLLFSRVDIAFKETNNNTRIINKAVDTLICLLVFITIFGCGYSLIHYTVVAAVSAGTGIFLLLCAKEWKTGYIFSIVFLLLSYLIRENIFFLAVPFAGLAYIYQLILEKGKWLKKTWKYVMSAMIAFIVLFVGNRYFPGYEKYDEYRDYNEQRTRVYDYVWIYTDDNATSYYLSQGVEEDIVKLYSNYDVMATMNIFSDSGMDYSKEISQSQDILKALEGYGVIKNPEKSFLQKIKDAVYTVRHFMLPNENLKTYEIFLIIGYIILCICMISNKNYIGLLVPVCAVGGRLAIWSFFAYSGRYPDRVLISTLLLETMLLLGCICNNMTEKKKSLHIKYVFLGVTALLAITFWNKCASEYREAVNLNKADDVLYSYMKENSENMYYLDVYSVVYHSEYAVKDYDASFENYMYLGGWITGHPLIENKYDMVSGMDKYIVLKKDIGADKDLIERISGIKLEKQDEIYAESAVFEIYHIVE